MTTAYTATSAKLFFAARIQKKCSSPSSTMTYTALCSCCQRFAPSAFTARLNEVAASGSISRKAVNPTRANGRFGMSWTIACSSKPMSSHA
jgi:hypothetical protein